MNMNDVVPMFDALMSFAWMAMDWSISDVALLAAEVSATNKWLGYLSAGLQVAAGLGFVIFVHELGHFLAAKSFGVKCEKFYVGFDVPISIGPIRFPRTLGKFRWGETEYGIGIIPLGGYVKMLGQDDDPRNAETESQRIRQGDGPDAPLDPRSYQAKTVWQRMIIISAGVVMNLIFAVFLAAAAFLYGVPYTPTTIGSVPAGSPAWQAGILPGDHVLQVAEMSQDDPYLRYEEMAGKTAFYGMRNGPKPVAFTLLRDGNRMTISPTPTKNLHPDGYYMVGLNPATTAEISEKPHKYSFLASQGIDLREGDRIIAVDGQPLPIDSNSGKILSVWLTQKFQAKWNQPIELTVLRRLTDDSNGGPAKAVTSGSKGEDSPATELKVTVPPVPTKTLGLGFSIGPITAIRQQSLAEEAGMKVGDVIEQIDGQPIEDALRLPMRVAEKLGKPIEFVVRRPAVSASNAAADGAAADSSSTSAAKNNAGSAKTAEVAGSDSVSRGDGASTAGSDLDADQRLTFTLQSDGPVAFANVGVYSAKLSLENFGIAYSVQPRVSWVDPEAEKASKEVRVGDVLTQVQLEVTSEEIKEYAANKLKVTTKPDEISARETLPAFLSNFQQLPEGIKIRCSFQRDGAVREVVLPLFYDKDWYWMQRGVPLTPLQKTQKTNNVIESLTWGFNETGRRLGDVFASLSVLVTGRASAKNLVGPFGIAEIASREASDSPSRLLLFLTFLSANLAILNFLPIPALDGGHMMFLIAEAIRGKPLNEALQVRLTMLGVVCLLGLMAFAILNDVLRYMN